MCQTGQQDKNEIEKVNEKPFIKTYVISETFPISCIYAGGLKKSLQVSDVLIFRPV